MKNLESNKLIAEFMCMKQGSKKYNLMFHGLVVIDRTKTSCAADELRFNISWDWLMPVALKCVESAENMQADEWVSSIQTSVASYKSTIESAYKEVIEFIKWYNKNK